MTEKIFNECGLRVSHFEPVYGGDINEAFCLYSDAGKYFLKVNDAHRYPGMFEKEKNGLEALQRNSPLKVPKVIKSGIGDSQQFLLLEWIDKGVPRKDFWQNFGAGVATMHQQSADYFGWNQDNYIGSLPQKNTMQDSWPRFYSECRIMPLIKILYDEGKISGNDISVAESVCNKLDLLFPPGPPALLHGDLWGGNYMIEANGYAALFDPAVYFGHREMDIGMTKLFGGFDQRFYNAYNEIFPLEQNWLRRLPLTQLYPLLVHAVLFGGHYSGKAVAIMKVYA